MRRKPLKVCVSECPADNYSPWLESQVSSLLEGVVKEKMRPFCTSDTTEEIFSSLSVSQLLDRNYCPPWWVESQQVLGRCLPSLEHHNSSDNSNSSLG